MRKVNFIPLFVFVFFCVCLLLFLLLVFLVYVVSANFSANSANFFGFVQLFSDVRLHFVSYSIQKILRWSPINNFPTWKMVKAKMFVFKRGKFCSYEWEWSWIGKDERFSRRLSKSGWLNPIFSFIFFDSWNTEWFFSKNTRVLQNKSLGSWKNKKKRSSDGFWPTLCICLLDGRKEEVHFDKITSRIQKLCYGLNMEYVDPVSLQWLHWLHHLFGVVPFNNMVVCVCGLFVRRSQ